MVVKELDLGLDYKEAGIPVPEKLPTFTGFILQNYKDYCGDRKRPAVLVLPGGGRGVENLACCPQVEQLIRLAAAQGIPIAAICAAPTLLARWGLLEGKRAVCFPGLEGKLAGACHTGASVVTDGATITGRAAGSAFDFGLELVKFLAGEEKAEEVRHNVHYR